MFEGIWKQKRGNKGVLKMWIKDQDRHEDSILLEELTEEAKQIMNGSNNQEKMEIKNQFFRDCVDMVERISKFEVR